MFTRSSRSRASPVLRWASHGKVATNSPTAPVLRAVIHPIRTPSGMNMPLTTLATSFPTTSTASAVRVGRFVAIDRAKMTTDAEFFTNPLALSDFGVY
jgi:hypothetical protein